MQSTGHSSTHALSLSSMQGSAIVYVTASSSGIFVSDNSCIARELHIVKRMRFKLNSSLRCSDVGSRVTVRYLLQTGQQTDAVGVLEACTDETFHIRTKRGESVTIERSA